MYVIMPRAHYAMMLSDDCLSDVCLTSDVCRVHPAGDLFRLHSADDGAVTWLPDVAAQALAK